MTSSIHPRLIFVTGKGGVGKTAFALGFTQALKSKGLKAKYNCFDQIPNLSLCQKLGITTLELDTAESAEIYIGRKLGSQTIAHWVMKTPFFHSLFHMLPGLSMMILLGHLIDLLEADPELHIVVDSPSSGHALTLFEASHNFKEMFGAGKIVDDINRMHNFLYKQQNVAVKIVGLPTLMALQEGEELQQEIMSLELNNVDLYLNDVYKLSDELESFKEKKESSEKLPHFLDQKLKNENEVIENYDKKITLMLPHFSDQSSEEIIKKMANDLRDEC